jgi:hypothetical protein
MSNEPNQPVATGISKTEHDLAVANATAAGATAGRKAAHDRFEAILADDKIKGKETTALDLALKSPEMAAADVVSFVAALPAAAAQPAANAQPKINQRMNGQGADLALGGPGPMGNRSSNDAAQAANEKSLNPASVYQGRRKASA